MFRWNPKVFAFGLVGLFCVGYFTNHVDETLGLLFVAGVVYLIWKCFFSEKHIKQTQKYFRDKNDKVVDVRTYGTFVSDIDNKCWLEFPCRSKSVPDENSLRFNFAGVNKRYGRSSLAAKVLVKRSGFFYVHEWHIYSSRDCPEDVYKEAVRTVHQLYDGGSWFDNLIKTKTKGEKHHDQNF